MDRRTLLKTLVALGASLPLPVDLLAATESQIDTTWKQVRSVWGLLLRLCRASGLSPPHQC